MTKKRGRPKKLPLLQINEFDRQFGPAQLPAFLADPELTVLYANDYARLVFPQAQQPGGLRALLAPEAREECIRRIAAKESFRLVLPSLGGVPAAIAVTPLAEDGSDRAAGAMILVTCADPLAEDPVGGGAAALSESLRQPLSDIFASLAVMRRQSCIVHQDKQYDPYFHSINRASYQLLRGVSNLVSYQRGSSGLRGRTEVVDFWGRLAPILDACGIILHGGEIPFLFSIPDRSHVAHVCCCFEEIEDALMNLISNAFCHTREGNRVEVTGKNIKNGVVVTVSDCGRGIEPDRLDSVFAPFSSQGPDKKTLGGMGLGLTVARQNILMNGGTIAVDSTPGKGTSIAFTLPTTDSPITPPLMATAGAADYLQDHFSRIYIGLCDVATLPPQ